MRKTPTAQPQGLIGVLLNTTAEYGDRDDTAMDLGAYDEPEAEEALLKVASDPVTDAALAETCGKSLGEIWVRRDCLNIDGLRKLRGPALLFALGVLEARKPQWREDIQPFRG